MRALRRLSRALKARSGRIADAINADFGGRSRHETLLSEVYLTLEGIAHAREHLRDWIEPQSRALPLTMHPASARVIIQPLGVVGIIAPWNYPCYLLLSPLVSALAAGNRALLKPSEFTPRTSEVLEELITDALAPEVARVVHGDATVGAAMAGLPLDHLLFTGSPGVGRHVMAAAAANLTPVTLELGGKSPAIVHPSFPLRRAADRIAGGKLFNAGQTCIAPDYLLCPAARVDDMVAALRAAISRRYPRLRDNPDYTSIVNERHYRRLRDCLADAHDRGATLIDVNPAEEDLSGTRKIAPTLVRNAPPDSRVLQEELFGPILPIVPFADISAAIEYVNARPRPLALYYFDRRSRRVKDLLSRTISGGATINDTMLHCSAEMLPFGGVGTSGIGATHGEDGFRTFSHRRSVYQQSALAPIQHLISPPYGKAVGAFLKLFT